MDGTDSLRSTAPQWSLAGDKQLLGVLQNIHERLVSRCQETNKRLGEMTAALDDASIDLQNVNNKFMALSNSQFIESRVYDDDADVVAPTEAAKDAPKTEPISELEQMKLGLRILEDMHEPLQILDSDTDSDSEEEMSRMVLKPKDLYSDRPLPFIIGSYAWQSKWHAGLLPEDSDTDSSVKREPWEREEYSESETEASKPYGKTGKDEESISSEDFGSDQVTPSQSAPVVPKSQASVANELARRLRGELPEPELPEEEYVAPTPQVKRVYRPEKPAPSNIFLDEPPPLEQSYQSDEEDDIFAELRKNQPYAQSSKVQNSVTEELFGNKPTDDIFSDFREPPPPLNQKSTLFSDDSEPELFAEPPPPVSKQETSTESNVKKPIGGVSLFGNKGTESIGAAILKRNQRQSSTEEDASDDNDTSNSQRQEKERDIFDHLFAKSEKEQRKAEKKVEKQPVKEVKVEKKVDLFNDNLFDDIDDIFTSNIPKVPIKTAEKNQKSLFDDDDDLFSNVAVAKSNNNSVKEEKESKRSIFDSDDDLFTDKLEKNIPAEVKSKSKDVSKFQKETSIQSDTKKSIFDSDDELFAEKSNESKTHSVKSKSSQVKSRTKSIFDDSDSDRFSDDAKTKEVSLNRVIEERTNINQTDKNKNLDRNDIKNIETSLPVTETKKALLFDDDAEDLFKPNSTNKEIKKSNEFHSSENNKFSYSIPKEISKDQNIDNEAQNVEVGDALFAPTKEIKDIGKAKKSIFDDVSEDELFSDKPKTTNKNNEKTKSSIFANDDDLFKETIIPKTTHITAKEEILKNEIKEEILEEIKDEIKSEIKDQVITELKEDLVSDKNVQDTKIENKQSGTIKPVSSSIFDDEDDIFKDSLKEKAIKNDKIEKASKKTTLFDDLEDDLFTNSSSNIGKVNQVDDTHEEAKKSIEIEPVSENIKSEIPQSKGKNELKTQEQVKEKLTASQEEKVSMLDKPDVFDDIFIEPPEFEKPKEPKKSKNINALFDDDSDDEALFFKKDDPTLDEKPEFESPTTENRLFGLFQDEPPALDVDFVQKTNVKSKKVLVDTNISFENNNKSNEDISIYKDNISSKPVNIVQKEENTKSMEIPSKYIPKTDAAVPKKDSDKTDSPPKSVGKLKNMNFNINVNALLPGASPKKAKATDQTDGNTQTKSSEDIRIKNTQEIESKMVKSISFEEKSESQVLDNTVSKERAKIQVKRRPSTRRARKEAVRKSGIDFGDDSTDNSSSIDDQPKNIKQVHKPDQDKAEVDNEPSKSDDETSNRVKNIRDIPNVDVEEPIMAEVKKDTSKIEKHISHAVDFNTKSPVNIEGTKIKHEESPKQVEDKNIEKGSEKSTEKELTNTDNVHSHKPEVTTKTVYILNDEDIFNIEKPKKVLNIVDDPGISTLGKVYSEPKMSNSDTEDDLFRNFSKPRIKESETKDFLFKPQAKNTPIVAETIDSDDNLFKSKTDDKKDSKSIFGDDKKVEESIFKPETKVEDKKAKSIFDLSDDEDLFSKNKTKKEITEEVFKKEMKKVDVKASLFGDDDDDDLFGSSSKKIVDTPSSSQSTRAKEVITKSSEPVFEDPLSLLGGGADD